ncbi:hypothetical protein V2G26_002199 [Clonostachys chloroleuca]
MPTNETTPLLSDNGISPASDRQIDEDEVLKVSPEAWAERFIEKGESWRRDYERKLIRKVDLRLMPTLIIMYLLNFLDRSNLTQARQGTLEQDLGMQGTDYNAATSIFFVGYLLMQLPSNLLLTRVRPSWYLASSCLLWGIMSTSNAASQNFTHLIVIRFFLGFVEAPFFPGAVFLMSSWYTRAELTQRIAWLYTGNALANMFGGLLGATILGSLEGALGISGWRWLFLIEGGLAVCFALLSAFLLPDYPHTTTWLDSEGKAFAAWRLLGDYREADSYSNVSVWQGVLMAIKDYRLYAFIVFQHTSLLSQSFQYFFPVLVGSLGYDNITTLWLTVPCWFATFLISIAVTFTSAKTQDRSIHIIGLMLVATIGNAIAATSTVNPVRYFAMFLMPMGSISAYQILVAWVANSFPRPLVKRSAVIAISNMIGNTATIYGSYMYPYSTGPRYILGSTINTAVCLLVVVLAIALRFIHVRENKRLERAEEEQNEISEDSDAYTEARNLEFRYIY